MNKRFSFRTYPDTGNESERWYFSPTRAKRTRGKPRHFPSKWSAARMYLLFKSTILSILKWELDLRVTAVGQTHHASDKVWSPVEISLMGDPQNNSTDPKIGINRGELSEWLAASPAVMFNKCPNKHTRIVFIQLSSPFSTLVFVEFHPSEFYLQPAADQYENPCMSCLELLSAAQFKSWHRTQCFASCFWQLCCHFSCSLVLFCLFPLYAEERNSSAVPGSCNTFGL